MLQGKKIVWNHKTQEFLVVGLVLVSLGVFITEVAGTAIKEETAERWRASGARAGLYFAEGSREVGGHWVSLGKAYGQEIINLGWQAPAVAVDFASQMVAVGDDAGIIVDQALLNAADNLAPRAMLIQRHLAQATQRAIASAGRAGQKLTAENKKLQLALIKEMSRVRLKFATIGTAIGNLSGATNQAKLATVQFFQTLGQKARGQSVAWLEKFNDFKNKLAQVGLSFKTTAPAPSVAQGAKDSIAPERAILGEKVTAETIPDFIPEKK